MAGATGAEPDKESLRKLLLGLKELPPKIRTDTRRQLRRSGDAVIAEQKALLDQPLPTGIAKTGWQHEYTTNKKTGKKYLAKRNVYSDVDTKNKRSNGRREAIKAGLKLRITATEKTQEMAFKTTGPRVEGKPKYNFAKVFNKAQFRHPVFGSKTWVYQKGMPYFNAPVLAGRDEIVSQIDKILRDTI